MVCLLESYNYIPMCVAASAAHSSRKEWLRCTNIVRHFVVALGLLNYVPHPIWFEGFVAIIVVPRLCWFEGLLRSFYDSSPGWFEGYYSFFLVFLSLLNCFLLLSFMLALSSPKYGLREIQLPFSHYTVPTCKREGVDWKFIICTLWLQEPKRSFDLEHCAQIWVQVVGKVLQWPSNVFVSFKLRANAHRFLDNGRFWKRCSFRYGEI